MKILILNRLAMVSSICIFLERPCWRGIAGFFVILAMVNVPRPSRATEDLHFHFRVIVTPQQEDARFGASVALSADGGTALAGEPGRRCTPDTICGAAYVFRRSGGNWASEATLLPIDLRPRDDFGASVALSADGNTALVGAPEHGSQGAAYVFRRSANNQWRFEAGLLATEFPSIEPRLFGASVALSTNGNLAIIGAPSTDCANGENLCGAAYVFRRSGGLWLQEAVLRAPNARPGDFFASSVAIERTTALVVAPERNCINGSACGAVYMFRRRGEQWQIQSTFTETEGGAGFGSSVVLPLNLFDQSGQSVLIGAPGSGFAYELVRSRLGFAKGALGWRLGSLFGAEDDSLFGASIATSRPQITAPPVFISSTTLVGAPAAACINFDPGCGAAFVFEGGEELMEPRFRLTADELRPNNDFGASVALSADGSTALVGAPSKECANTDAPFCGVVYIFDVPR